MFKDSTVLKPLTQTPRLHWMPPQYTEPTSSLVFFTDLHVFMCPPLVSFLQFQTSFCCISSMVSCSYIFLSCCSCLAVLLLCISLLWFCGVSVVFSASSSWGPLICLCQWITWPPSKDGKCAGRSWGWSLVLEFPSRSRHDLIIRSLSLRLMMGSSLTSPPESHLLHPFPLGLSWYLRLKIGGPWLAVHRLPMFLPWFLTHALQWWCKLCQPPVLCLCRLLPALSFGLPTFSRWVRGTVSSSNDKSFTYLSHHHYCFCSSSCGSSSLFFCHRRGESEKQCRSGASMSNTPKLPCWTG